MGRAPMSLHFSEWFLGPPCGYSHLFFFVNERNMGDWMLFIWLIFDEYGWWVTCKSTLNLKDFKGTKGIRDYSKDLPRNVNIPTFFHTNSIQLILLARNVKVPLTWQQPSFHETPPELGSSQSLWKLLLARWISIRLIEGSLGDHQLI